MDSGIVRFRSMQRIGVRVRVRVDERVPEKTGGFLVVCTLYVYISWCACNVIE